MTTNKKKDYTVGKSISTYFMGLKDGVVLGLINVGATGNIFGLKNQPSPEEAFVI